MKKNQKKLGFIILIVVLMSGFIFKSVFDIFDPFNSLPTVLLVDDLTVEQFEEVTDYSFVLQVSNGKISSSEKKIDTTTLGEQEVIIVIENRFGKKRDYKYYVKVVKNK